MVPSISHVTSLATLKLLPSFNLAAASQGGETAADQSVEASKQAWQILCLPGNCLVARANPDAKLDTIQQRQQKRADNKNRATVRPSTLTAFKSQI